MAYEEKRVMVAVRVRPRLPPGSGSRVQQEEWQHTDSVSVVDDLQMVLREQKQDESCRQSQFTFDFVFDQDITQTEVYEESVQELVDAALSGINCTILAYGQTGSGKTFTVLGEVCMNPLEDNMLTPKSGLFLRVLKDLFEYRRRREGKVWVVVALSCIEIYCDSARDLLSSTPGDDMKIQMTDEHVYMPSLTRVQIFDLQTVYRHFKVASSRRQVRATEANDTSSRSHALFVIDIVQQEVTDRNPSPPDVGFLSEPPHKQQITIVQPKKSTGGRASSPTPGQRAASPVPSGGGQSELRAGAMVMSRGRDEPPLVLSKIVLADLAGSERSGGKAGSGAVHGTAGHKEMVKINSSLTALGNVVHALHEGSAHVPYRDSTLTRVLRPSFSSPASRSLLCANLSPTQLTYDESWSTLQFANKVKAMKVSNSTVSAEAQQLAFDYLETQKTHWALLADHHICQLHHYNDPVVRKFGDLITDPYKVHRLRKKAQEKERARAIADLVPKGLEDKARIQAVLDKKKQEEHQALMKMKEEMRQEEIDRYQGEVAEYQRKIEEAVQFKKGFKAKLDSELQEHKGEMAKHTSVAEACAREQRETAKRMEQATAKFDGMCAEEKKLTEERKKKQQLAQDARSEKEALLEGEDKKYCWATWGHCKAQQFFLRFKAYRETQVQFYESKRQNLGRIHQAHNEARKLAKYLKDGSSQQKSAQGSGPAPQSPMTKTASPS